MVGKLLENSNFWLWIKTIDSPEFEKVPSDCLDVFLTKVTSYDSNICQEGMDNYVGYTVKFSLREYN
ncbi:MAG: hypothetical protein P0116_00920 [Candidatus Nitrosocosmicus sp.]|nr:hypothetical protein [Candidatus Nitrosocosmicus sp.]